MPTLRAALIGYGLAGRFFHAPLITATQDLDVASIVTSNPERKAEAEHDHPRARVYQSVDQLWEDADAHDLVVVATRNDAHAPLARHAIDHRLPVVVDKPLAVTAGEAEELIAHAEHAGILLTTFQNRRWDSDHLTLSRLMTEGRLGDVFRYESRFERWRPAASDEAWRDATPSDRGGGQLLDLGSHLVDQALSLFGPVTDVYGEVAARRGSPADDDAFVALTHVRGTISHLRMSAVTAAPGPRLRVLGTKAAFVIDSLDSQEDRLRAGERPDTVSDWGEEPESSWGHLVIHPDSEPVPSERGNWPHFYDALAQSLRAGEPPPVDPRDAVQTLRILEAARTNVTGPRTV